MACTIYYFSATGNSLVAARHLAAELGDASLVPVTAAINGPADTAGVLAGIVFPVYMFGLPLIIRDFLGNFPAGRDAYIFTVATMGGLPGLAHTQADAILRRRGGKLSAGFSLRMPGNYTPLYEAIPESRQKPLFAKEEERIKQIARLIREKRILRFEENPYPANFLLHKLLYKGGSSQIPLSAKGFWVNPDCVSCGTCADICPVLNIEMRQGHPAWLDHCQHCMACLQWCPVNAIQYKKSTQGKRRYHHPQVTAADICRQQVL